MKYQTIISLSLFLSIFLSGCIDNENSNKDSTDSDLETFHYEILINAPSSMNYSIICPIPLIKTESHVENPILSSLLYQLEIEGEGNKEIINTSKGIGLMINGYGSLRIISHKEMKINDPGWGEYIFYKLSLRKRTDSNYVGIHFFNLNTTNNELLSLSYHCYKRPIGDDGVYTWKVEDIKMNNGWNEVDLLTGKLIIA